MLYGSSLQRAQQFLNLVSRMASTDTKHFGCIVIGGGAGMKVANQASERGLTVALCEKERIGGTCLNRGCIPSKMLIHPADLITQLSDEAAKQSITLPAKPMVDFEGLVSRVAKTIDEEAESLIPGIEEDENMTWVRDAVHFVGPKTLTDGNMTFSADKIFIASGARPSIPDVPGLDGTPYMTSREALRNTRLPKRLLVVGGGYIAVELAHFYAAMGSEVHIMVRTKRMLRGSDGETAAEFARIFAQSRTHVHLETGKWLSSHFDAETHNFTVTFESGLELSGDQLLIVTGVRANTDTLALDKTGVHVDDDGFIKVDGRLRTSCADIWAFGDCVGNYMFRHSANFESDYLNETVFEMGNPKNAPCIDYTGMPHAVFSSPQLAGVGETEEELQQRNAHYVKGVNPYAKSAMGMALQSEGGFAKLLVDADTRRILGFHVVGPEAANLVHVVIPLMRLHGKLEDLLYCVYVHPALAEIVRNAARRARNALAEREIPMPFLLSIK